MNDYFQKWCCIILVLPHDNSIKNNIDSNKRECNLYSDLIETVKLIPCTKHVYYSNEIDQLPWNFESVDIYKSKSTFNKTIQFAFAHAFDEGFRKVIYIDSCIHNLECRYIEEAFLCLKMIEFVTGSSTEGKCYLLGMNYFEPGLLTNADTLLPDSKRLIKEISVHKMALYKLPVIVNKQINMV